MQTKHFLPVLALASGILLVGASCAKSDVNTNLAEDLNVNVSVDDTNAVVNTALNIREDLNTNASVNTDDTMEKNSNSSDANENDNENKSKNSNENDKKSENANTAMESEKESVSIESLKFDDATLTVKKGTTVTWTNKDSVSHTITSTTGSELASSTLAVGGTYSHTFTATGTFTYHCTFHPSMTGTVIVQ